MKGRENTNDYDIRIRRSLIAVSKVIDAKDIIYKDKDKTDDDF